MHRILQLYKIPLALTAVLVLLYGSFAYDLERHDFIKLITLCFGLFGLTYVLINYLGNQFRFALGIGLVLRLVFLLAAPNLSQDFYRFIWDGLVVTSGGNPFLFTPEVYLEQAQGFGLFIPNAELLYEGMGSLNGSHFSNYPPVNQLFFALSVLLGGKSIFGTIIAMRLLLIAADIGVFYFGWKLLKQLKIPKQAIYWYFLNPFIIIEITGNLHFEAVMLFFLVASLYYLKTQKWFLSGIFMALSISLKLIPLVFLPIVLFHFWKQGKQGRVNGLKYFTSLGSVLIISFLPFINQEVITHFLNTTALWFQNFEFNASIYYVVRYIGYQTIGWNIIETAGKVLAISIFLIVMILALFRKNQKYPVLLISMLIAISLYYLLATTVHPWYIALPLILGIFSGYQFPIIWSAVVFLSYSAYGIDSVNENLWLVAIEYLLLLAFVVWEWNQKQPKSRIPNPNQRNI